MSLMPYVSTFVTTNTIAKTNAFFFIFIYKYYKSTLLQTPFRVNTDDHGKR